MGKERTARAPGPGRVVRPAINGKTQIARTSDARWSLRAERIFLTELAATCNVRAAAAAAGFSTTAIYNRRMRSAEFAAAWALALDQGYARIETALVELASARLCALVSGGEAGGVARAAEGTADGGKSAGGAVEGAGAAGGSAAGGRAGADAGADSSAGSKGADAGAESRGAGPAMSIGEMMNLLRLHRASARGGAAQNYDWRAQGRPGPEELDAVRASILRKIEAIERADKRKAGVKGDEGA
ncbi:MAG: hypothetical protein KKD64_16855 [Alphaproteobacteria bacterium]|nr:hypothetical protein [Alphaproteobacteria bacterium]MBU0793266.1 hypothetical protein [Alphaproteobacteria bacterium]MBU0875606.1 hypothetical protein [Alphaproteobacteria bacterium]MBU1771311.1 hypothetical protein [Alphaproteobacteria bacterium]